MPENETESMLIKRLAVRVSPLPYWNVVVRRPWIISTRPGPLCIPGWPLSSDVPILKFYLDVDHLVVKPEIYSLFPAAGSG